MTFFSKKLGTLALCSAMSTLSACATGGFNGHSGDAMNMMVVAKHPDRGPVTEDDYNYVVRMATYCLKEVADKQLSSAEESALVDGVMYGIAGAAGVGGGSSLAGLGSVTTMGLYGGPAGAANGVVSGLKSHSNAKAGVVGHCTSVLLQDRGVQSYRAGVFAFGSFVRTKNSSRRLPSWVQPGSGQNIPKRIESPEGKDSDGVIMPPN